MKVLNYEEIDKQIRKDDPLINDKLLFDKYFDEFERIYSIPFEVRKDVRYFTEIQWIRIVEVLKEKWKTSRILDLGCGCKDGVLEIKNYHFRRFNPWLCRFLYMINIPVVGIDIGSLRRELFEHYQLDLLRESMAKLFEKNSFDLVNASALFTSPELEKRVTGRIIKEGDASIGTSMVLREILLPQVEYVCKENGYFLYKCKNLENFIQSHNNFSKAYMCNLVND